MLKSGLRTSWATPATREPIADIVSLLRSDSCSAMVRVTSRATRITRSPPERSVAPTSQVRPEAASRACSDWAVRVSTTRDSSRAEVGQGSEGPRSAMFASVSSA